MVLQRIIINCIYVVPLSWRGILNLHTIPHIHTWTAACTHSLTSTDLLIRRPLGFGVSLNNTVQLLRIYGRKSQNEPTVQFKAAIVTLSAFTWSTSNLIERPLGMKIHHVNTSVYLIVLGMNFHSDREKLSQSAQLEKITNVGSDHLFGVCYFCVCLNQWVTSWLSGKTWQMKFCWKEFRIIQRVGQMAENK